MYVLSSYLLVGQGVVPPEEACCEIVGHQHIHSIVVMGQEDAEDAHCTQSPAKPVVPPKPLRGG